MAKTMRYCHLCGTEAVLADFEKHLKKCRTLWLQDRNLPADSTKYPPDPGLEERPAGITQEYLDSPELNAEDRNAILDKLNEASLLSWKMLSLFRYTAP